MFGGMIQGFGLTWVQGHKHKHVMGISLPYINDQGFIIRWCIRDMLKLGVLLGDC